MAKKNKNIIPQIISASLAQIKSQPIIIYPFIIIAFFELLAAELIYFLPRWPLNLMFFPIARALSLEQALSYPLNLLFIYRLFYYAQILIYCFVGGLLTAAACHMILCINENKPLNFKLSIKFCLKKYIDIFCIALIATAIYLALSNLNGFIVGKLAFSKTGMGIPIIRMAKKILAQGLPYFNFIISILSETIFAYVLPILIIKNKKLSGAIKEHFIFLKNNFLPTAIFILIAASPLLLFIYLTGNIPALMDKTFPEIAVVILIMKTIFSIFISAAALSFITMFYLSRKGGRDV